ncbi:hypothetical protein Val02_78500 [Virgisporangium aliadipatigenens]|uniref:Uncharacterized protein n=1 Tax=Virgisporangium aliadipatigenens TaxID=741659 RepID=A0A8J4DUM4_9ACTN|nr:hypothetical protein [Virgisporangium aliadipatigenens]GIJ50964.1 hypothetical protein Val02_78500 [Virgisporangium aliadipatigenens]
MGRIAAVATDAAAWHLTVRDPTAAIELLEVGRSVLSTGLLDERPDLSRLELADSGLARRLIEVGAWRTRR